MEMSFTEEEEKALAIVYDIFDNACEAREEDKGCEDCPFYNNCPLIIGKGSHIQAMKNFIKKIAE